MRMCYRSPEGQEEGHCHIGVKNIIPPASYQPFLLSGSNIMSFNFSGVQYCRAQQVYLKKGWFVILQWWMHTLSVPGWFLCRSFTTSKNSSTPPSAGGCKPGLSKALAAFAKGEFLASLTFTISVSHTYLKINSIILIPYKMLILTYPMNVC